MDFKKTLIKVKQTVTDWIHDFESAVPNDVINPTGNWQGIYSLPEPQSANGFDSDSCATFSALNILETTLNYKIAHSMIPQGHVDFLKPYMDSDGKLDFSDRFTSTMSGTSPQGNSFQRVWDSIRHDGLVPETWWPFPKDEIKADLDRAWEIYSKYPTDDCTEKGLEFLKYFQVDYELVGSPSNPLTIPKLQTLLKTTPIQIGTLVSPYWFTKIPIPNPGPGSQHATQVIAVLPDSIAIIDQYPPFEKFLALDYNLTWAYRGIVSPIGTPPPHFTYTYNINLYSPFYAPLPPSTEVHALQQGLQQLGYMTPGQFGWFGPATRTALYKFQQAKNIAGGTGSNFGPASRLALTNALNG